MCWPCPYVVTVDANASRRCDLGWATPSFQQWREDRKVFHQEAQTHVVAKYRPVQLEETHEVLVRFVRSPEHALSHLRL